MSAPFQSYQPPEYLKRLQATTDSVAQQVQRFESFVEPANIVEKVEHSFHQRRRRKQLRARGLALVGLSLWFAAFSVFALAIVPQMVYALFPESADRIARLIGETVDLNRSGFGETVYEVEKAPEPEYVPPFDPSLPAENRLIISDLGINAEIGEGEDWEEVLRDGVWRAGNFGTPRDHRLPIILAAHRFGYLAWSNEFRRTNSFYNLPKLENGMRIEIVWGQRKYLYEVYEGYTDTQLKDLDADLILFTCQILNSDQRIIRKARQIVPPGFKQYTRQAPVVESMP